MAAAKRGKVSSATKLYSYWVGGKIEAGLPTGIMFNPEYQFKQLGHGDVSPRKFLYSGLIGPMLSKRNKGVELRWLVYGKPTGLISSR